MHLKARLLRRDIAGIHSRLIIVNYIMTERLCEFNNEQSKSSDYCTELSLRQQHITLYNALVEKNFRFYGLRNIN